MEPTGEAKDKRVLVIDDDESICFFLKVLLEKEGFKVEVAYDGELGVKVVNAQKVDLIVLDWMMPVFSGFDVIKLLQTGEHKSIPVIIITARLTDQNTIKMIQKEMNVAGFMSKPIQNEAFISKVHEVLGTKSSKGG